MPNKTRNRLQRAYNGNIKKNINVVHWNLGPAHWVNKLHTIEAMMQDFKPYIAIISEANIFLENQDYELYTPGYELVLPDASESLGCCHLAVLIREGFQVKILTESWTKRLPVSG